MKKSTERMGKDVIDTKHNGLSKKIETRTQEERENIIGV